MTTNEKLSARARVMALMNEFKIEPKKSLGQNFLISDHVIDKILDRVRSLAPQSLIEVGPGLGALTVGLQKLALPLQLLELDAKFAQYWREQGLNVIEVDALKWNWSELSAPRKRVFVSNLPYQISSSIVIDRTLDDSVDAMVLMFQKEVAQRLKARVATENYGMLSVFAQSFWNLENLLEASSGDFLPPPKVASRVLVFQKIDSTIREREQFLKFIKACFLQPRKLMISNLMQGSGKSRDFLITGFDNLKLKEKIRAQEVTVKQFIALYQVLGYR